MSDELPPYEGQNWLCLTDEELLWMRDFDYLPQSVHDKLAHLTEQLQARLAERAKLPPAEPIPAGVRTDRGGLEQP